MRGTPKKKNPLKVFCRYFRQTGQFWTQLAVCRSVSVKPFYTEEVRVTCPPESRLWLCPCMSWNTELSISFTHLMLPKEQMQQNFFKWMIVTQSLTCGIPCSRLALDYRHFSVIKVLLYFDKSDAIQPWLCLTGCKNKTAIELIRNKS